MWSCGSKTVRVMHFWKPEKCRSVKIPENRRKNWKMGTLGNLTPTTPLPFKCKNILSKTYCKKVMSKQLG